MLTAGQYQTLRVARISEHGLYLADEDGSEVLLPNRYVSISDKENDEIEVFVYHDTENRLIATREHPLAVVSDAAFLKVVDKNAHGVFLDWGITAKDIFMPNSNEPYRMEIGQRYVVYLYLDNVTGRVVASGKLNSFIKNESLTVRPKEQVEILVTRKVDVGYRVIVNNRHWGVVYDNELFKPLAIGNKATGYIRRITDDNRIDISLQQQGFDEVKIAAERLKKIMTDNGGRLALTDKSSPEEVSRLTEMSKKVFKRAVGYLLSHNEIRISDHGTELKETAIDKQNG